MPYQSLKFVESGPDKIQELQRSFKLDFGYVNSSGNMSYLHGIKDGNSYMSLIYDGEISADAEELTKFKQLEISGRKPVYYFNAVIDSEGVISEASEDQSLLADIAKKAVEMSSGRDRTASQKEQMAAFINSVGGEEEYQKLKAEHENANKSKSLTLDELAEELNNKKTYFFTGAGLSTSVIPDWSGLMKALGSEGERSDEEDLTAGFARVSDDEALRNTMTTIHETHQAFIHGAPTPGHKAITAMSKDSDHAIFTDNRDLIQQSSGAATIHPEVIRTKNGFNIDPTEIDCLVVCGMGGDRRGLITWLKEQNPELKVVNLNQNNSLANEVRVAAFVEGDLQDLLPSLQEKISELKPRPSAIVRSGSGKLRADTQENSLGTHLR
jgi:hypothetical protein